MKMRKSALKTVCLVFLVLLFLGGAIYAAFPHIQGAVRQSEIGIEVNQFKEQMIGSLHAAHETQVEEGPSEEELSLIHI